MLEITIGSETIGDVEVRERAGNLLQAQVAALGDAQRARENLGRILEDPQHLVGILDEKLVALKLHPVGLLNRLSGLNAQHYVLRVRIVFAKVVAVVRRNQRQSEISFELEQSRVDAVFHLESLILNLKKEIFAAK